MTTLRLEGHLRLQMEQAAIEDDTHLSFCIEEACKLWLLTRRLRKVRDTSLL